MMLSRCPWWCAPVLASGLIVTVPAHSFCAPVRAKLIAALRSIPGVDGTLGSSWLPGMTRTPSCFQRSAWEWPWLSFMMGYPASQALVGRAQPPRHDAYHVQGKMRRVADQEQKLLFANRDEFHVGLRHRGR